MGDGSSSFLCLAGGFCSWGTEKVGCCMPCRHALHVLSGWAALPFPASLQKEQNAVL